MKIPEFQKNGIIARICRHEAGHYTLARLQGFITGGMTALFPAIGGHIASAVVEPWTSGVTEFDGLKESIRKRIKVLYAGAMAESFTNNGIDPKIATYEWEQGGAMNDYAKIRELTQILRNISFPGTIDREKVQHELNQLNDENFREVEEIILSNKELIETIANRLIERVQFYDENYYISDHELDDLFTKQ